LADAARFPRQGVSNNPANVALWTEPPCSEKAPNDPVWNKSNFYFFFATNELKFD
jgi:hypothetical protein